MRVRQETTGHRQDRRANHQLDVTARHPAGDVRHLLVEYKDWSEMIGKLTIDALAGMRHKLALA